MTVDVKNEECDQDKTLVPVEDQCLQFFLAFLHEYAIEPVTAGS